MRSPEQIAREIMAECAVWSINAHQSRDPEQIRIATWLTLKHAELIRALEPDGFRTKQ